MRITVAAGVAMAMAGALGARGGEPATKETSMRACLTDSLEQVYPDSDAGKAGGKAAAVDVARGGMAAVHVLLNGVPAKGELGLAVRSGGRAVAAARWYRLIDVPVEVNTGSKSFVEKAGDRNPNVTRRAPFRVYDAMEPVPPRATVATAAGGTMALRLEVPIPRSADPNQRTYNIQLNSGGQTCELTLAVAVHKAIIPPVGKDSLPYTNWFNLELMASRHKLKPWSQEHWDMIARYARLMVAGRQNTFWVVWGDVFARDKDGLTLDRKRLGRIVQTFTDAGMYFIEGGHVAHRTGGKWEAPTFDISLNGPKATTVEGNADLARACKQLMEEIDRNGWRGRWIQHVTDEPIAANAVDYRILVGMTRKYMPGLPILDATMDPNLAGSVDIWCPQCQEYQKHRDAFEANRKLGDRVWFYTCCSPGGPWLNRLLDMELLRPALFGWAMARFDLDGFLHWGLNHYRSDQDPFNKSVVSHGEGAFLPAGDTHIVYPGKDGPWSSLRLEAQREGFEDYELLKRLKAERPKEAESIVAQALRGFNDYTKDVKVFRAARKAMLEAMGK